jgi:hypothetical protein
MPHLQVYIDEETRVRLADAAKELGRTVVSLAESAVSEAALDYDKRRPRRPSPKQAAATDAEDDGA